MKLLRLLALSAFLIAPVAGLAQKLDPNEVITKHIASIGPKDKLSSLKNQIVLGNMQFTFVGAAAVAEGKALIMSSGEKSLWGMNFNTNDYPQDRFAYDGKQVKIGRATTTNRSLLGEFLYNNRELLKGGLLGGALSTSWALLNPNRKAMIEYEGRKAVNGVDTIVLAYTPSSGGDINIKLYFDPKTYRHVRSEYTVLRAAAQGATVDNSAGQSGTVFRLVEDFSDFKKMGDLNLPATYRITYSQTGTASITTQLRSNRDAQWTLNVTDFGANREIDENSFNVDK